MAMRDTLNNNSAVVTIGAVTLLVVSLLIVVMQVRGRSSGIRTDIKGFWFYDMGSETFYLEPLEVTAPSKAPSGKEGVKAMIFTCGEFCGNKDLAGKTPADLEAMDLRLGWYTKLSPEGVKMLEQMRQQLDTGEANSPRPMLDPMMAQQFELILIPGTNKWQPQYSAQLITDEIMKNICPTSPRICMPGMK